MIDINDDEQVANLKEAINSDEGQLIMEYFNQVLADQDFMEIDESAPNEIVGQEFKVMKKIKQFLNELLIFNN